MTRLKQNYRVSGTVGGRITLEPSSRLRPNQIRHVPSRDVNCHTGYFDKIKPVSLLGKTLARWAAHMDIPNSYTLSRMIGCSPGTISNLFYARTCCGMPLLRRIATITAYPLAFLMVLRADHNRTWKRKIGLMPDTE